MKLNVRFLLAAGALALVVAGGWLSTGTPNLTVINDGIGVTYPWRRGLGSLVCAAGLVLLAEAGRRVWLRVVAILLAVVAVGVGLYQLTYRLDTTADGIASRAFLAKRTIAWREVLHVGSDPTLMVVSGTDNRRIAIDTTDFSPNQRLVLSRTITRRINEVSAAHP